MAEEMNESKSSGKDVEENKLWAVLAYIGVLVLIPLLAKRDSKFAMFHAKQGLVLFIAGIVIGFVAWIPFLGWLIGMVGGITVFILAIMGILNALGGKTNKLPLVGQYAEKLNI